MQTFLTAISSIGIISILTSFFVSWMFYRKSKESFDRDIKLVAKAIAENSYQKSVVIVAATFVVALNAGLLSASRDAMLRNLSGTDERGKALKATVAGVMIHTKAAANGRTYACLASALGLYTVIGTSVLGKTDPVIIAILVALLVLVHANQRILEFRIRKGFYGFNPYEAKEIISFILSHSDKTDFKNGDGGLKDILPEADMESTYATIADALPEVQI